MSHAQQKIAQHRVPRKKYKQAQNLRRDMPRPERIIWYNLRAFSGEWGTTFRRQQPVHPYIADFCCMALKLVIELDGDTHDTRQEQDQRRDVYFHRLGYKTLRFTNDEVMNNLDGVMETVAMTIREMKEHLGLLA